MYAARHHPTMTNIVSESASIVNDSLHKSLFVTSSTLPTVIMSEFADTYRLPTDVKPTHYEVTVRTDLEKLVFDGFVRVL